MEPRVFVWPLSSLYSLVARAMEPAYSDIARRLEVPPTASSLLDMGGGDGRLAIAVAKRYPFLSHVVTADLSKSMATLAAKRIERAGLGHRVTSEVQDGHSLTYDDGMFDVVTSFGSLHHWAEPAKVILELCRILEPGGILCLFDGYGRPTFREIRESLKPIGGSFWTALAYWQGGKDVLPLERIREIVEETGRHGMTVASVGPIAEVRYRRP